MSDSADPAAPDDPRPPPRDRRIIARLRRSLPGRRGPLRTIPDVQAADVSSPIEAANGRARVRVMTLNLAHGRSAGFHQAFMRRATIVRNLDAVSTVLERERPHVVTFQEADGPSAWSGGFDHVAYLAEAAGFAHRVRGTHVSAPRTDYGTAIAARLPLSDPLSVTFAPSPPTLTKGFVIGTVTHPEAPEHPVDVVSLHLDFARPAVRRRQIETLIEELRLRDRLRVVTGDFNTGWSGKARVLKRLAEALDLRAHDPEAPLVTFPLHKARLDWVFASKGIDIAAHRVLPDVLSDHRAVVAELVLPG